MSYDPFAQTFSQSRRHMRWQEIDLLIGYAEEAAISLNHPPGILDLGCGSGRLLNPLQSAFPEFRYVGIDESAGMITEAGKTYPGYDFRVGDMRGMKNLGERFDFIFLIASFHHLRSVAERTQTLRDIRQVLADGGILLMTNWNLLSQENLRRYAGMRSEGNDFLIKIGQHKRFYHSFEVEEIGSLHRSCGFDIILNKVSEGGRNIITVAAPVKGPA